MKHRKITATLVVALALSLSACMGTMRAKNENTQPQKTASLSDTVVQIPVVKQPGMSVAQEEFFETCLNKLNKEQRAAHAASTADEPLYLAYAASQAEYLKQTDMRNFGTIGKALLATVTFGKVNKIDPIAKKNEHVGEFNQYMGMCYQNKMMQLYAQPR